MAAVGAPEGAYDYDLIVVGGGGAGLSGAVTAAEAGLKVLLLESEGKLGGSTGHSEGVFNAADTNLQRALGMADTIEAYYDHYMTLNAWRLQAPLVRTFCEEATPTLEWLISLGVRYEQRVTGKPKGAVYPAAPDGSGLYAAGREYPPRGHRPIGSGQAYIDALEGRASALGVEIILNTRVQALLIEDGEVCGVDVDGERLRSGAVLLACGGFGHDPDLLHEYFPELYQAMGAGDEPFVVSAPGSRGDAIRMGRQAGAEIYGRNIGLLHERVRIRKMNRAVYGGSGAQPTSLIYVNGKGRRFFDETAPYSVTPGLMRDQDYVVWGIFDEAARLRSSPEGKPAGWSPEFILDCARAGDFRSAETLSKLAQACGLGAKALEGAVRHYNADLPSGRDHVFGRDLTGLFPIAQPPFYAFEYRLQLVAVTGAGPRIDCAAHVLNEAGDIIPGLFAAGEAGAGVLGERYVGGGNSVANALTMGRVAGRTIARERGL
jgi:fumarate reductase flavoprotein subunit